MNPAKDDPGAVSVKEINKSKRRVRAIRRLFEAWLQGDATCFLGYVDEAGKPHVKLFNEVKEIPR